MKVCVITRSNKGNNPNDFFDVKSLKNSSLKFNHEFSMVNPEDLVFSYIDNKLNIDILGGGNILDFDVYIIRISLIVYPERKNSDSALITEYLISNGKTVLNISNSFRSKTRNKMYDFMILSQSNIPLIPSIYLDSNDIDNIEYYISKNNFKYPLILKSIKGLQGRNLFKVENFEEIKKIISKNSHISFMIQEYYKILHDLRVIVLDGKILGAMEKIPKEGDFRGNISQGASGKNFELDKDLSDLVKRTYYEDGTEFIGIDIAITDRGTFVLEVNRGLGFEGFSKYLDIEVSDHIIKYLENKFNNQ